MRRRKQEITDRLEVQDVLSRATVCHLALADGDRPYVLPLLYGYDPQANCLYFHVAREGYKLEILERNPRVCFEVEADLELAPNAVACAWSIKYRSVIGFGTAVVVTEAAEREAGLQTIMQHYAGAGRSYAFEQNELQRVLVLKVPIESMSGKQAGYR